MLVATGCKDAPVAAKPPAEPVAAPAVDAGPALPPMPRPPERTRGCNTTNVQAIVKANRDAVTRCYRKVLAKNEAAAGRLSVEIDIDKTGTAKFLGVKEDDFGDEEFTRCVFAVLKPLPYPIPDTEPCIIIYPFVFTAGPRVP